jgi:hypothetical protein
MFGDLTSPPRWNEGVPPLENPNSTFKPSNFKHPWRNYGPKWSWANFRCMVISHPCLGGIKGSSLLKNPNSTFKPSNFKHLQRNLNQKRNWANFRCSVIWSWYIPQALEIPIFRFKKYIYKEKWTKHHVICNFNIHLNDFKVCGKNKCPGSSINHKTLT